MHWTWSPHTLWDGLEALAWIALIAALIPFSRGAVHVLKEGDNRRRILVIGGLALAARLVVPWVPINWYSGVGNVDLGQAIFSRDTTYMPLPNQLLTFTLGFAGIVSFNILLGTFSAVLAWHVVRRAGYGERVAVFLGLAVAVTPLYVRLSASDSSHLLALPLWWLAALAMQRLVRGSGGRADQLVLLLTPILACPIRIEAGLVMPSVGLLVARDVQGLREVWSSRARWSPLLLGLLVGMTCSAIVHPNSWHIGLGQFSVSLFVLELVLRSLFVIDPDLFGFIPLFYVLLIWYYLYTVLKEGRRAELAATILPFVIFAIPYAYAGKGIGPDLPGLSYGTTITMFLLLGAAKGAAQLQDRVRRGAHRGGSVWRGLAVAVASLALLAVFAIPYRATYAYQEELSFLTKSLPPHKVKVLAIWDPAGPSGDYDCCVALPYPTLIGDYPEIEWQILGQADADESRLRDLHFDYYYPGSLVSVDTEHSKPWLLAPWFPDPHAMSEQQAAPLRKLRTVDELIRKNYPLTTFRQAVLLAHTFGWAPFRDDQMTLTIYRHSGGAE